MVNQAVRGVPAEVVAAHKHYVAAHPEHGSHPDR
ncbi:integral membrane protein [Mycobacterium tuberculosis]|nr:integral membrane protein [Mycobacterium tuberculosis]AMC74610.1 integral membrane protein [Mycobacterium tuberculosis]CKL87987.1 Uncharacterised protein [Mycobacterium tuberculosis]CKT65443.1 Uncharacterised protein [Mycobacterium tuberculosis]CKU39918.1 Uncharacterised protein [Mycobacterium tuberculosis]